MLLRLCQLKSLLLLLLLLSNSCSGWKSQSDDKNSHEMISMFSPRWFESEKEHALIDSSGQALPHLFFDVTPEFSMDGRMVNVIITTPQESDHYYRLDLLSGQRHYAHTYCKQKDVWEEQSGTFYRPPFSIGHIPRILDQLGTPQKVIFFSDTNKIRKLVTHNYLRVKLVAAYVESSCPQGNCAEKNSWLSRLVFIGVDQEDKRYSGVNDLSQLLKHAEWPEIKATLENIEGRNQAGTLTFPFIKVGPPLAFKGAFEFFKKHSIFFADEELNKIKSGCTALYDRLWTEVGMEQPEDRPVKSVEELNATIKLREELKKKKMPIGFAQRFQAFTRKYYDEVVTCNKFVYGGNINHNQEKFWFLKTVNFFFQLHRDGYYFDCRHKSWYRNTMGDRGESVHDLKKEIVNCNEADLDQAMALMSNFLEGIRGGTTDYYRFIDYDNNGFGTHNKLYSWVKLPGKKFDCANNPNEKIRKIIKVFPEEVKWKEQKIEDIETQMKIIY
jgi:hypothetical protein